ncbi:MAG: endonuclease V [Micromonosporaceae bacterium]|nr:endonuclease V [Micromonosporaceae bacterium]
MWPRSADELVAAQLALGARRTLLWRAPERLVRIGACWVCFRRGVSGIGAAGEPAWVAGVLAQGRRVLLRRGFRGVASGPYLAGLLALRIGPLCEQAIRSLGAPPDVVLLDATGRDHPRRAGFALHLGAVLGVPTVGVTHRPLLAEGAWPADEAGATSPLTIDDEQVGWWLRTRRGTRPLAVHAGWRTDPETALEVVRGALAGHRTPEPLRAARHTARRARAAPPS